MASRTTPARDRDFSFHPLTAASVFASSDRRSACRLSSNTQLYICRPIRDAIESRQAREHFFDGNLPRPSGRTRSPDDQAGCGAHAGAQRRAIRSEANRRGIRTHDAGSVRPRGRAAPSRQAQAEVSRSENRRDLERPRPPAFVDRRKGSRRVRRLMPARRHAAPGGNVCPHRACAAPVVHLLRACPACATRDPQAEPTSLARAMWAFFRRVRHGSTDRQTIGQSTIPPPPGRVRDVAAPRCGRQNAGWHSNASCARPCVPLPRSTDSLFTLACMPRCAQ
ncbi:H-NS histone family domain protein [Burkholderia pseudomallei MSHR5492]|nr:H-NS histone family domain protein [Burkholderia pseudomallei MSHR5492]